MARRLASIFVSVVAVLAVAVPVAAAGPTAPAPTAMAALGDSITRAFHTECGLLADCPAYSWTTGSAIDSHRVRLEALVGTSVRADNLAVTGAEAADLGAQAQGIAADTDYVTILVGANDACADTVGAMTPVAEFKADVAAALGVVHARAPDAAVYVASIPDLQRLLDVGKASFWARFAWSTYGICQSMLADPLSTDQADVDRRATVRQRVVDYNAALVAECAAYAGTCHDDGGTVFSFPFQLSQLSTIDYFHPNVAGQQVLAQATWDAGYSWTTEQPPGNAAPTADAGSDQVVTADESGTASVTLDGSGSSDPDGDALTHDWTWASGAATGVAPTITLAEGTYEIVLTVDDGNGGSDTDAVVVVVDAYVPPPPATVVLHVGDLDGAAVAVRRNRWEATVDVTVHDADEQPVAGVLVEGAWGGGASGSGTCTTGTDGTCSTTSEVKGGNKDTATFTVSGLSAPDATRDASADHDPDGDSDGTTIVVAAP